MLAIWVKARVKADQTEKFLKAIEHDALGSERDEPGCLRFNVLRDEKEPNVYYFFEVYKDEAALEAHRKAPRSEEHTSELQSPCNLVCRLLLEKKNILSYTNSSE